jgi:hypothetical protein
MPATSSARNDGALIITMLLVIATKFFFLFDISLKIGSADKNKQQPKRKMHTQILALT